MKKCGLFFLTIAIVFAAYGENYVPTESDTAGRWFIDSVQHSRKMHEAHYVGRLDKLPSRANRAKCAEDFHTMLESHGFQSYRAEDEAIEKALGWKKGDFTCHNNFFYTRTGCTSWLITPELSVTGACMLQKNRDYKGQNLLSVRLFRSAPGKYKIITVNDLWSSGAGAVMNEKGLMIVQDDASNVSSHEQNSKLLNVGCIFILRYIAENCAELKEAVAMLEKFYRTGIARSNSLYLLADLERGMIVETTARHLSKAEVNFGFEVRSNNYLLPGMRNLVNKGRDAFLNVANRRYEASEFLRKRVAQTGRLAPFDLMQLSRLRNVEVEKKYNYRSVCYKYSLASTMLVPDRMFPDILSVAFVACGPQRHTVFLPIPMGLTVMPESLVNGSWGTAALQLAGKLPLDHDRIPEFEVIEKGFIEEFFATREKARRLILNGKRRDAVKMLDELFKKQYEQAKKFISELNENLKKGDQRK